MNKFIRYYLTRLRYSTSSNNQSTGSVRAYGWWLYVGEKKVGELDYVRWDEDAQFWHEYKINIFDKKYLSITKNSDDWYLYEISIMSKNSKYSEVHKDYVCTIRTDGIVAMRGLCNKVVLEE